MIKIAVQSEKKVCATFYFEQDQRLTHLGAGVDKVFKGSKLETVWLSDSEGKLSLCVGMGEEKEDKKEDKILIKEVCAKAVQEMKEKEITEFSMDVSCIVNQNNIENVCDIVEGAVLGAYEKRQFKEEKKISVDIDILGVPEEKHPEAAKYLEEARVVAEGICFARDMVNLPGNRLRPEDFAREVMEFVSGMGIEAELYDCEKLKEMNMHALLGVGESSQFPPCLLVLRYFNDPTDKEITALVGKGVTFDTGGYCIKPSQHMLNMNGDMGGGAAVAGAVYALAKNKIKTNVVAAIPMCENRISPGSMMPGDVIGSYSGKTIEIINTDAEGRLILADAVSYVVKKEKATRVLDIATLTGAVVSMLGFSVGGVLSDNDSFFHDFREAYTRSGERYWRLPSYPEHEKMIESDVADVKNLGESHCGTITAGLFIQAFAEKKPWLHLDIAGTGWVEKPIFAFQSKGATGAGVSSIYQLCCKER